MVAAFRFFDYTSNDGFWCTSRLSMSTALIGMEQKESTRIAERKRNTMHSITQQNGKVATSAADSQSRVRTEFLVGYAQVSPRETEPASLYNSETGAVF